MDELQLLNIHRNEKETCGEILVERKQLENSEVVSVLIPGSDPIKLKLAPKLEGHKLRLKGLGFDQGDLFVQVLVADNPETLREKQNLSSSNESLEAEKKEDFVARTVGIIWLGFSLFLFYAGAIDPLVLASKNEPTIKLSLKVVIFGPIFLIWGLIYSITGAEGHQWLYDKTKGKLTTWGWFFSLSGLIMGLAIYFWIEKTLHSQGYK